MIEETWQQRRDRLANEYLAERSYRLNSGYGAHVATYQIAYDQCRADLLKDAKVLENRIEIMISEIKECMKQFPQNGMHPSTVFAESELYRWRKKMEE